MCPYEFAIPIGIALSEIITNAINHAFPQPWTDLAQIKFIIPELAYMH